jgi:serine/threonine-protein kinase
VDGVSVISGRTNTVTATIAVGVEPFGIAVDPKTTTAYAANFHDNTVSVLAPCPRTSGPSRDS